VPGLNTMSATTTIATTRSTRDTAYQPPDPLPDVRLGGRVALGGELPSRADSGPGIRYR